MRLRGVKTAALNKVRLFRDQLVNVHSGVTLKNRKILVYIHLLFDATHAASDEEFPTKFSRHVLTFPVRNATLVSGS